MRYHDYFDLFPDFFSFKVCDIFLNVSSQLYVKVHTDQVKTKYNCDGVGHQCD